MVSTGTNDEQVGTKAATDHLFAISKFLVAAILIAFLISKVNFSEVAGLAGKKSATFLILAILLGILLSTFESLNLSLVLRVLGYGLTFRQALIYTMVGIFF